MSRPTLGVEHVAALEGPEEVKERLRTILETLGGNLAVTDACDRLGVSASRFHELRAQALTGALDALAPRASGRPRVAPLEPPEVTTLRAENVRLHDELELARIRTEIALTMPRVLRPPEEKKGSTPKRDGRRAT